MSEQQQTTDHGAADQAAEIERLAAQAAGEDYQPDPEAVEGEYQSGQPDMATGELCTALLSLGFGLVAARKGPHWQLSEAEATETGNAVGAVLDKYFPDMSAAGPELMAVLCIGTITLPRLAADRAIDEQRRKQEQQQKAQQREQPQRHQPDAKQDAPRLDLEAD